MATLVFLYKLSHEIKVTYVQELIDALRYVGRTLLAARPLELAMGNVRSVPFHAFWPRSPFFSRAVVTDGIPRKSNASVLIHLLISSRSFVAFFTLSGKSARIRSLTGGPLFFFPAGCAPNIPISAIDTICAPF